MAFLFGPPAATSATAARMPVPAPEASVFPLETKYTLADYNNLFAKFGHGPATPEEITYGKAVLAVSKKVIDNDKAGVKDPNLLAQFRDLRRSVSIPLQEKYDARMSILSEFITDVDLYGEAQPKLLYTYYTLQSSGGKRRRNKSKKSKRKSRKTRRRKY